MDAIVNGDSPAAARNGATLAPVTYSGPRTSRTIALTVDDDYNATVVGGLLDLFISRGVNATFFPVGTGVGVNAAVWKRAAAAGFPLGTHTWDHKSLTTLTYAQMVDEIESGNYVIEHTTGVAPLPVLRPPYGNWSDLMSVRSAAAN